MEEFVTFDFGGDAERAVGCGLDADDLPLTADIDIAGLRDLFGKGDDEVNEIADVKFCLGDEIEAAITDVARLRFQFDGRFMWKYPEGKGHSESPCYAAFGAVAHETSLRGL